jgi:phage terminase large subunit-like protein
VGQEDRRGSLFPTKQRDWKIDGAEALLMAIGRAQAEPRRVSRRPFGVSHAVGAGSSNWA